MAPWARIAAAFRARGPHARGSGAVGYLEKGADPAKIAATVEEVAGIVVQSHQKPEGD